MPMRSRRLPDMSDKWVASKWARIAIFSKKHINFTNFTKIVLKPKKIDFLLHGKLL